VKRIPITLPADFAPGQVHVVPLGRDPDGYMREALIVRDVTGTLRAYRNLCKHLPIPLDGGSREFMDASGQYLECGTHGATYRPEDGLCIAGPCEGERLDPLALVDDDGQLTLHLPE
jgi:nitrite reductase/ring-hydroxylating ferredoxin subunit